MSQPYFLMDKDLEPESTVTTDDASHITGSLNTASLFGRIPMATYQWLIVVGALAALWALRFGFRSDLKVG